MKILNLFDKQQIFKIMKLTLIILITVFLISCNRTVVLDIEPFIVEEIESVFGGETVIVRYVGKGPFMHNNSIIAKAGLYNVGDTIRLERK